MAEEPKLDGELAWAISDWNDDVHNSDQTVLRRSEIESLTRHLSAAGFRHQGEVASVAYLESINAVLNPIYKPVYDAIMKAQRDK